MSYGGCESGTGDHLLERAVIEQSKAAARAVVRRGSTRSRPLARAAHMRGNTIHTTRALGVQDLLLATDGQVSFEG